MWSRFQFFKNMSSGYIEIRLIISGRCERFGLKLCLLTVLTEMEGTLLFFQHALNNQPSVGCPA